MNNTPTVVLVALGGGNQELLQQEKIFLLGEAQGLFIGESGQLETQSILPLGQFIQTRGQMRVCGAVLDGIQNVLAPAADIGKLLLDGFTLCVWLVGISFLHSHHCFRKGFHSFRL